VNTNLDLSFRRHSFCAHGGVRFGRSLFQRAKSDFTRPMRDERIVGSAGDGKTARVASSPARSNPLNRFRAHPRPDPTAKDNAIQDLRVTTIPGIIDVQRRPTVQHYAGVFAGSAGKAARDYDGQNGLGAKYDRAKAVFDDLSQTQAISQCPGPHVPRSDPQSGRTLGRNAVLFRFQPSRLATSNPIRTQFATVGSIPIPWTI